MAIKPPNWAKGAIPTPQGWKNKRTGELLVAQKISKSQIDEFFGVEPEIQTLTESPTTAEEAKEEWFGDEATDLDSMTKLELEALGREQDVTRVQAALQFLQGMPPDVLAYVKWTELLGKAFYGLNLPDAVRTESEMQQMQQMQMQQQAMMGAGQTAMAAGGAELATQAARAVMSQQTEGEEPDV